MINALVLGTLAWCSITGPLNLEPVGKGPSSFQPIFFSLTY